MATTQRTTRRNAIASAKGQAPRKKPEPVLHLSVAERAAKGRSARSRASRSTQAAWQPPTDRAGPVEILRGQEATRVPELAPIRHGRMLVSPFTFYRGAAR